LPAKKCTVSSITTEQGILHYEVYGRGRPVILLHGWLGSWELWQETMTYLGSYYRTYALDFWGFGESGNKRPSFSVIDYVSMVNQFMEQLGILRAPLVGHSMGGTVSLKMAIDHPERVTKVVVIGSPVDGDSLALLLKLAGLRWIAWLVYHNLWALRLGLKMVSRRITRDSRWSEMINQDLSRVTLESFLLSIASLRQTDLTPAVHTIQVPVMGMYGTQDNIVHPNQWRPICALAPYPQIQRFNHSGHFPMLDDPQRFMHTLHEFLNGRSHG
jgi:pimeloyl-ACP methyl ester carboxylesterase